jgi:hypothetical protein
MCAPTGIASLPTFSLKRRGEQERFPGPLPNPADLFAGERDDGQERRHIPQRVFADGGGIP